jgi:hypothetical protein
MVTVSHTHYYTSGPPLGVAISQCTLTRTLSAGLAILMDNAILTISMIDVHWSRNDPPHSLCSPLAKSPQQVYEAQIVTPQTVNVPAIRSPALRS